MRKETRQVVGIIPSRYASSRFPGKPLALIAGKPMIRHVVERARLAQSLSKVVVATDDRRIADEVRSFGGEVVMTGGNHRSGSDRLAEAANILGLAAGDIVVNIQGDQPSFQPQVVEQVARPLLADPALPMATLIYKIVRREEISDPNHVKTVFDRQGRALYFSRATIPFARPGHGPDPDSQAMPDYYKHLGFYAYRKDFLDIFVALPEGEWERLEKLEQLRALEHGYPIQVVLTEYDSIEIDTEEEIRRIEAQLLAKTGADRP
ncbi:MAG: 3-deoxy-manno-octulosonate cytidylyltransferase [Desulfobulbaceae bacterium]|jgi:3-deoxy-manno-octulosonate cytidylyltransferase (CMP-KDO synthetase)|nr:3-deoxy-manno-octulosonate cytidylyltransferase [Desulfobulbaceae bacterium]